MSEQVVLLWQARWLNESWTLSRALQRHTVPVSLRDDGLSRRVFDVCQAAITGVPGYAPWDAAEVLLGYSGRSVRRLAQAGKLGRAWQGNFSLSDVLHVPRARLRTTLLPAPRDVEWWGYVPLLMERAFVPAWFAWHAWGRLSLPDLSSWSRRFVDPPPTPGRDILGQVSLDAAELAHAWQAAPVAVRVQPSESGRWSTSLFNGADLARLEWNHWVLQFPGSALFSEAYMAPQNGARLKAA